MASVGALPPEQLDETVAVLLDHSLHLTALELYTELQEAGYDHPRLAAYFSNDANFAHVDADGVFGGSRGGRRSRSSSASSARLPDFAADVDGDVLALLQERSDEIAALRHRLLLAEEDAATAQAQLAEVAQARARAGSAASSSRAGRSVDGDVRASKAAGIGGDADGNGSVGDEEILDDGQEAEATNADLTSHEAEAVNFIISAYLDDRGYSMSLMTLGEEADVARSPDAVSAFAALDASPPSLAELYRRWWVVDSGLGGGGGGGGLVVDHDEGLVRDLEEAHNVASGLEVALAERTLELQDASAEVQRLTAELATARRALADHESSSFDTAAAAAATSGLPTAPASGALSPGLAPLTTDRRLHAPSAPFTALPQSPRMAKTRKQFSVSDYETEAGLLVAAGGDEAGASALSPDQVRSSLASLAGVSEAEWDWLSVVEATLPGLTRAIRTGARVRLLPILVVAACESAARTEESTDSARFRSMLSAIVSVVKRPPPPERSLVVAALASLASFLGGDRTPRLLATVVDSCVGHVELQRRVLAAEAAVGLVPFVDAAARLEALAVLERLAHDRQPAVIRSVVRELPALLAHLNGSDLAFDRLYRLYVVLATHENPAVVDGTLELVTPALCNWCWRAALEGRAAAGSGPVVDGDMVGVDCEIVVRLPAALLEAIDEAVGAASDGTGSGDGGASGRLEAETEARVASLVKALGSVVPFLCAALLKCVPAGLDHDAAAFDGDDGVGRMEVPPRIDLDDDANAVVDLSLVEGSRFSVEVLVAELDAALQSGNVAWPLLVWMVEVFAERVVAVAAATSIDNEAIVSAYADAVGRFGGLGTPLTETVFRPVFRSVLNATPDTEADTDRVLELKRRVLPVYVDAVLPVVSAAATVEFFEVVTVNMAEELFGWTRDKHQSAMGFALRLLGASHPDLFRDVAAALRNLINHANSTVRLIAAELVAEGAAVAPEAVLSSTVVPALVAFGSTDDQHLVRAAVGGLGAVLGQATAAEAVVDEVGAQVRAFAATGSTEVRLELLRALATATPTASQHARDAVIAPALLDIGRANAAAENPDFRMVIALSLYECYRAFDGVAVGHEAVASALIPGLRLLLDDANLLDDSYVAVVTTMIRDMGGKSGGGGGGNSSSGKAAAGSSGSSGKNKLLSMMTLGAAGGDGGGPEPGSPGATAASAASNAMDRMKKFALRSPGKKKKAKNKDKEASDAGSAAATAAEASGASEVSTEDATGSADGGGGGEQKTSRFSLKKLGLGSR